MQTWRKWMIVVVLGYVLLHVPFFLQPDVQGTHQWRQADTAAVARNFATESMNFFLPRVDARDQFSGVTGMEFPLFNYLVALVYKVTHTTWVGWGKGLSLLCALLSMVWLSRFVLLREGLQDRLLWFTVFGFMPFVFNFSSKFMPEFLALLCAIGFVLAWRTYQQKRRGSYALMACLALAVSMLIRPYYAFYGLPMLIGFIQAVRSKAYRQAGLLAVMGAVTLLPFALWYGVWFFYLNAHNGFGYYFYLGSPFSKNVQAYFTTWVIVGGLLKTLCQDYLGWVLLPFFVYGSWQIWRRQPVTTVVTWQRYFYAISVLIVLALPLVIGTHFIVHYYYLDAALPAVVIASFLGVQAFVQRLPKIGWTLWVLILLGLFAGTWHHYRFDPELTKLDQQKAMLLQGISKQMLIVTPYGKNPIYLYALDRKGWAFRPSTQKAQCIAQLRATYQHGAKALLLKTQQGFTMVRLSDAAIQKVCPLPQ